MTDSPNLCCVTCSSILDKAAFQGLEVDLCPKCGGLWLERGEITRAAKLLAGGNAESRLVEANGGGPIRTELDPTGQRRRVVPHLNVGPERARLARRISERRINPAHVRHGDTLAGQPLARPYPNLAARHVDTQHEPPATLATRDALPLTDGERVRATVGRQRRARGIVDDG